MSGRLALAALALAAAAALAAGGPAPPRPRVLVLMFSTPNIVPEYAGLAAELNERYARRHGYAFEHAVADTRLKSPVWDKVRLVRERLPQYDAVFWIDSDAAFNRVGQSLEPWLRRVEDVVACSDHPNGPYHVNCGTMLVKNTPWCRSFMDEWWRRYGDERYHRWAFEQEALHDMIDADALGCRSRVRIEPAAAFNSVHADLAAGKRDTFVLHFMATPAATRRKELQAMLDRA